MIRAERWIAHGLLIGLAVALAIASTFGTVFGAAAVGVAAFVAALAAVGRDRMVLACFAGAFATAPIYRGIEFVVTATDLLLLAGIVLLVPELLTRRVRLPVVYVLPLLLIIAFGLRATLGSANPFQSGQILLQWMVMLAVVPLMVAVWQPSRVRINVLLWSYLAGHMVSTVVGLAEGSAGGTDRYAGLTIHPVIFGFAGATCVAIVAYLYWQYTSLWPRVLLLGVAAISIVTTVMSGSRAATLAAAALIVIVPMAERTVVGAVGVGALGILGVLLLPAAGAASSEGSSLARLVGGGTSQHTNELRSEALTEGWARFLQHPLLGNGLDTQTAHAHNVYLGVAIGIGLFGAVAYVVVLLTFVRPLLSEHPLRRLAYLPVAAIMLAATAPSAIDRTTWLPMTLAILPVIDVLVPRRDEPDGSDQHSGQLPVTSGQPTG